MDPIVLLALVAGLLILATVASLALARRRDAHLRDRFGPEYDRAVAESGAIRAARSELTERERRVSKFDIRPLDPALREHLSSRWMHAQARFVDAPSAAIAEADGLVAKVMRERGYPVEDFDTRAADLSVEYPEVVHNYRAAHGISLASGHGMASTEDERQAMIYYRSLFAELLGEAAGAGDEPRIETHDPDVVHGASNQRSTIDLREQEGQFRYR